MRFVDSNVEKSVLAALGVDDIDDEKQLNEIIFWTSKTYGDWMISCVPRISDASPYTKAHWKTPKRWPR